MSDREVMEKILRDANRLAQDISRFIRGERASLSATVAAICLLDENVKKKHPELWLEVRALWRASELENELPTGQA